ncbi:unnamed protein product [[Candida] boidinii]|uniref:Unnamed protein product n=1 Tax=Candida boidinii TaxID=5477 RepID=A0A9W6SYT1_CANBO|nr:hypothetical protein B5S30_g481 [[Candida] boidinii]OWB82554.1 hypothetical protein B5S33_g1180 [[Candida] boidinii]GME68938.1 unnamed protein product [[Candida] boidinii]GMF99583.1 unnamed protein product [[Candida] boidinii]
MAKKGGKKGNNEPEIVDSDSDNDASWDDGAKKPNKKQLSKQSKRDEELSKKKEREELLKMEEELNKSSSKTKSKSNNKKNNKSSGLDDALNSFGGKKTTINAHGIEDSIAALSLLGKDGVNDKELDRHPERRMKAALASYTERRMPEIKAEQPGLRKNQYEQLIFKEFQKSDENPMNKETNLKFNATDDDVRQKKDAVKKGKQSRFER